LLELPQVLVDIALDINKRDDLLSRVGEIHDATNPNVYVSLEDFFDGNDDLASFWCNLETPLDSLDQAFTYLKEIRVRAGVRDLKIQVKQFDGDDDEWPFSDTVIVFTDVDPGQVQSWFDRFPPDDAGQEETGDVVTAAGGKFVWLWWD